MIIKKAILFCLFSFYMLSVCTQVRHTIQGDKYPWSKLPDINVDHFKFIILPDRTGSERPNIFDDTRAQLNSELPDFYITIGDMIEGFTQNEECISAMWNKYLESVSVLKAPIFFIPGNHDISNKMMENVWKSKFGTSYYYFVIGNNLFLILNSDDGGESNGNISKTQSDYFIDVIDKEASGKKIFVFIHRPLWEQQGDMLGYQKLDNVFKKYAANTTVFCGHEHRYKHAIRNDIPHYMVASLGGCNNLRDVSLGEFDHYMLIGVDKDKISIVNKLTDGTPIPKDIVTDDNIHAVDALSRFTWFETPFIIAPQRFNKKLFAKLILSNTINIPLAVSSVLPKSESYYFSKDSINHIVAANTTDTLHLEIIGIKNIDVDELQYIHLDLRGTYELKTKRITMSANPYYTIDYFHISTKKKVILFCSFSFCILLVCAIVRHIIQGKKHPL